MVTVANYWNSFQPASYLMRVIWIEGNVFSAQFIQPYPPLRKVLFV